MTEASLHVWDSFSQLYYYLAQLDQIDQARRAFKDAWLLTFDLAFPDCGHKAKANRGHQSCGGIQL